MSFYLPKAGRYKSISASCQLHLCYKPTPAAMDRKLQIEGCSLMLESPGRWECQAFIGAFTVLMAIREIHTKAVNEWECLCLLMRQREG